MKHETRKEYKIFKSNGSWRVYLGYTYNDVWHKEHIVFWSPSIADCYAWIKAKQENLVIDGII